MKRSALAARRLLPAGVLALGLVLGTAGSAGAFCLFNCKYTKTRYPIVLAHGLFGAPEILGIVDYWFQIPSALEAGGARVFVTQVPPVSDSTTRGEQLLQQVEYIVAATGAAKVNLIGHSQGGPDVRYVASVRPDLVASVTTVAGVNKGADLADFIAENPAALDLTTQLGQTLAPLVRLVTGSSDPVETEAAIVQLSSAGMAVFNAAHPEGVPASACGEGDAVVNGVRYFSWSGTGVLTNALDLSDPLLGLTSAFYGEANDGLVGRCSSHLGVVIRDNYFQNHLDEVNQVLGLVSLFTTSPPQLFRQQANRLKGLGL